jgi:energy-converting hydrogenase A subunit F
MKLGRLWNSLATPKNIPKVFSIILGVVLLAGFVVPLTYDVHQIYLKPAPQAQVDDKDPFAPYDRGGTPLEEPAPYISQYPQYAEKAGMVTSYLSPIAIGVSQTTLYFGTSILSSPGGVIDEILYYSRGFDTILESSIMLMASIIATWVAMHFTMRRKEDED